jgi:hypothetical protein
MAVVVGGGEMVFRRQWPASLNMTARTRTKASYIWCLLVSISCHDGPGCYVLFRKRNGYPAEDVGLCDDRLRTIGVSDKPSRSSINNIQFPLFNIKVAKKRLANHLTRSFTHTS